MTENMSLSIKPESLSLSSDSLSLSVTNCFRYYFLSVARLNKAECLFVYDHSSVPFGLTTGFLDG